MRAYACDRYGRGFTGETHGLGKCPSLGKATTSAPLNTSPAAVVSTACVLYAGTISQCAPSKTRAPLAPSVMMTLHTPIDAILRAASSAVRSSVMRIPEMASASVSFGVIAYSVSSSPAESFEAGAGSGRPSCPAGTPSWRRPRRFASGFRVATG